MKKKKVHDSVFPTPCLCMADSFIYWAAKGLRVCGVNMHSLAIKFKQRRLKQYVVKSTKKLVAEDSLVSRGILW